MTKKEFKPLSGREFPRFSSIKTFFRLPIAEVSEDFDVAICGIPFDGGVSYRPGCRFGPTRIREASSLGRSYHMGRGISVFDRLRVADVGDCSIVPINQEQSYKNIESYVSSVLGKNKKLISIGGDHSITLPILRAFRKHFQKPLNLIHFDAHLDTYPAAWDCEYHHGAFVRHAVNEGLVDPKKTIQIGIRGPLAADQDLDFIRQHGIRAFTVDDIRLNGLAHFLKQISTLSDFQSNPTYITYDIDNLDPAFAPGTGTPVPGGLTTYEVQKIFQALNINQLVGGDIVEVSPPFDHAEITSLAAVDALFEILCLMK